MFRHPERRFYHFLAEKLGMTVNMMLDNMESYEITDWIAFYEIQDYEQKQQEQRRKGIENVRKRK